MFSTKPPRAICRMVTAPVPKTMALGGVPTGSMKAQVAAKAAGISSAIGSTPMPTATPPRIGMKVAAVAVFDVTSVRNRISVVTATISMIGVNAPRPCTCWPNHWSRPLAATAPASDSPPPNSSSTPQGNPSSASFQFSTMVVRPLPGRMNSAIPAAMATAVSFRSSSGPRLSPVRLPISPGTTQRNAADPKTIMTIRSPCPTGPRCEISSSIMARPPGTSDRVKRNSTLVISTQAMKMKTSASGRPIIIHCRKPILRPNSSAT